MDARVSLLFGIALGVMATASYQLVQKGAIREAKAATFVPSGEAWIDDIARHANRRMWLAIKSSDYQMVLKETRGIPKEKTIQVTLQYQADPESSQVKALKTVFKTRFCHGFLSSELRENSLTKTLLFTDIAGNVLNTATLSEENCVKYGIGAQ